MLSRQFIREHPDEVREAARKKRVDLPLDRLLALDARVEDLKRELQARREESNRVSKSIGKAAPGERAALVERGRVLREEIRGLEEDLRALEAELHGLLLRVPNIPDPSVPEGADESANVPLKYWGRQPQLYPQGRRGAPGDGARAIRHGPPRGQGLYAADRARAGP